MKRCSKRIILASASPRRRELLAGLDVEFTIDTRNNFTETVPPGVAACDVPLLLARGKSHGFHRPLEDDEVLITADTVVIVDSEVLGKPHSPSEAAAMLRRISGRTHEVITAVVLRTREVEKSVCDSAIVHVSPLSEEEINYYIEHYKPFDKAGSYGVQEWLGYVAIGRIEGSFFNIMGFPVHKVWQLLGEV